MVPLAELWLPIVLSAVVVFVASSLVHMVLTYHRSDYSQLPDEPGLMAAMRAANLKPGSYVFPYACDPKQMGSPETIAKYNQGPVGMMTVMRNGPPVMPKFLGMWFVFCLFIGLLAAYLASRTLGPGTNYLQVFRVVGTAAFLGYSASYASDMIWKAQSVGNTLKSMGDGLLYALLTAGVFGWLWPR